MTDGPGLGPIPRRAVWPAALLLVVAVGALDFYTGSELSFSIFYLIPVGLSAWYGGAARGSIVAVLSAITWWVADQVGGALYSHPWISFWNAGVRLGFFLIVAALLARLYVALDRERRWASVDHVTDLLNSRAFYAAAERERRRASRQPSPLTLAYFDLDNYKAVNDQWGHATGDALLRVVGSMLKANLRTTDAAARLGGDEFALLLPGTNFDAADVVLRKLMARLEEEMQQHQWPVTASVGAVTFTEMPNSVDELVSAADQEMYAVKRSDKNALRHVRAPEHSVTV